MANILIQPLIRMLGWSASDLSQYGTQPTSGTVDAPAHGGDFGTHVPVSTDTMIAQAPHETAATAAPHLAHDLHDASAAPAPVATSHEPGAVSVTVMPPIAPIGAGAPNVVSFGAVSAFDPRVAFVPHHPDVATAPVAAPAQASPITDLAAGATTPAVDAALHVIANDAAVAIAPIAATVTAIATPLTDTATHLGDLTAPVLAVASVADLGHVTAPLSEAATTLTAPILDTAATLVGTPDIVAHATDALGTVVSVPLAALGDAADHFAGTDPAGGIQTLVTMVDSTDAFHIGPADTAAAPVATVVDTLAGDDLAPALLGIGDDHHDLHHDATDAHGILGSL